MQVYPTTAVGLTPRRHVNLHLVAMDYLIVLTAQLAKPARVIDNSVNIARLASRQPSAVRVQLRVILDNTLRPLLLRVYHQLMDCVSLVR
tara:strand:- start:4074 stop:4343 length:270 start_codon:yes stop_codon:yes gene_type:complete